MFHLIFSDNTSVTMIKSSILRGQPCFTDLSISTLPVFVPLTSTLPFTLSHISFTHLMNLSGILKAFSILNRYIWSNMLKAFSWSVRI